MNKYLLISILLVFIFIIPSNAEDNYIIDGNIVYINDENVYLSAQPHTIYESGYVYFNLTSKNYNGDIDAAFGFNTSLVKPKKAELYNSNTKTWINFPLSFTLLSYSYKNCDKWFYVKDIPIISNKNYRLRIWIETPISTNINKGKYLFAVKPSFESIQQSIDNNRLYVLDPWFNTSFTDRQKIIITTNGTTIPQNYQILLNVTYNSNMQNDFDDLRFTNLTNGSLSYWIQSKINSEYALIWVNLSDEIIHPNNDIIYMYYGNNVVNKGSNGTNTFIQYNAQTSIDFNLAYIQTPPMIVETRITQLSVQLYNIFGVINTGWIPSDDAAYITLKGNAYILSSIVYNDNTFSYNDNAGTYSTNAIYKMVLNGVNAKFYRDNILIDTITTNIPNENMGMFYKQNTGDLKWGFIRKYIENEPIINYNVTEYYTKTLHYNITNNYNHTIEFDGTIITNRSLNDIDNTYWTVNSSNITYWIFTNEINNSGYTNFTISNDDLNNFTVKLKNYSYYSLYNISLIDTFYTNINGIANININLIPDDYYILFINQSLIPPPLIYPTYPIQGILIFKDNLCINNINKIIVYKNNSYIGIYNYSDEIIYLNNTNYTFFINSDNIDIINSENFLITFFKNYGYILISIIGIIILIGICIYFFKKVRR